MEYAIKNQFHHYYDIRDVSGVRAPVHNYLHITYNFSNHFHPYTGELIEQLNRKSLAGLFDVDFQSKLVDDFFKGDYEVNEYDYRFKVNYPQKELDFSEGGPYSPYNWELFFHVPLTIAIHLSKNQRFSEAQKWFHYIFDPTSNDK